MIYSKTYASNLCGQPLNLRDAREMGFTETGEMTREVGYVSRRGNPDFSIVYIAGKGKRAGQFYYLAPCYDTTRYCWRVYIARREAGSDES